MRRLDRLFAGRGTVQSEPLPNPYWRRYDLVFCKGPIELRAALQQINAEGHVIVSITQDYSQYTIVFKRFD